MKLFRLLGILSTSMIIVPHAESAEYSAQTHNYEIEYLKPNATVGGVSILNITINGQISPLEAERQLREEIQRAISLFPPAGELLAYVWTETSVAPDSDEMVLLPDGSSFLIYAPATQKVQTEKQYDLSKQKPPQAGKSITAAVSLNMERGVDGRVRIVGSTNLPDGMSLMIRIRNVDARYGAQDSIKLMNGKFVTTWFSDHGKPPPNGTYEINISSPLPSVQSAPVRAVIGEQGENLLGAIRTSMGSKMIDLTVQKTIP